MQCKQNNFPECYDLSNLNSLEQIQNLLLGLADEEYKKFSVPLVPGIDEDSVIGVRIPQLRKLAKDFYKNNRKLAEEFMALDEHKYFEEIQIHGFMITEEKDFDKCLTQLEHWLPMVNNWSVCDGKNPKVLKKKPDEFLKAIDRWIESGSTYHIRFAVGMLMANFLDEEFDPDFLKKVCRIKSDEYYVNMMIAWYFATALAKQWDMTLPILQNKELNVWCHNKTIQKARESFRITPEQKEYLKSLKC